MTEILDLAGDLPPAIFPADTDPYLNPYRPAWYDDGLCSQTDPDAFFPEKGESTKAAKQVCAACPAQALCLEWALENQERFGVWGGKSERERRKILRDREDAAAAGDHPPTNLRLRGPRINVGNRRDELIRAAEEQGLPTAALAEHLGCSNDAASTARARYRKTSELHLRAAG